MTMKYDKFLHINLTKLYQVGKYEMRYFSMTLRVILSFNQMPASTD